MSTSIYLELTEEFNAGRLRCIVSSGQAVVLHRLAMVSKDGDWIAREDEECLGDILSVLEARGARYRFGAPLDTRWMSGGWSAHFEFPHPMEDGSTFRVRTDFVTRPPRLSRQDIEDLWVETPLAETEHHGEIPVIDLVRLAQIKKTNRDRDYAVIGELARRMSDVRDQLMFSRSARNLSDLALNHGDLIAELTTKRPVLAAIEQGRDALEAALDAERRDLIRTNEKRLQNYADAGDSWFGAWPALGREIAGLPLKQAHAAMVASALKLLPTNPND